jgi:hypothetical protein
MAEEAKGDLQKLSDDFHTFKEEVKPNLWFVKGARAILGASVVVIILWIFSLGAMYNEVSNHGKHLEKLEGKIDKTGEENQKSNSHLVEIILERFPRRAELHGAGASNVKQGRIVNIEQGKLVAENEKGQWTCNLTKETQVRIDLQNAKKEDLKTGMTIECELDENDNAVSIEALSAKEPRRRIFPRRESKD